MTCRRLLFAWILFVFTYSMVISPVFAGSEYANHNKREVAGSHAYDVKIRRDGFGVPHILGKTDADAAFGLAYAHSEDDFETIQKAVFAARGDLAMLEGAEAVKIDYFVALVGLPQIVDSHYVKEVPADVRTVIDAYAEGLNHYARTHRDEVVPGLLPIRGEDIVALQMLASLHFFGVDAAVRQVVREGASPPQVPKAGSNGVAISPRRSTDGSTRLLINPHVRYGGRYSWYEAVVQSEEGWHVAGGFFPGSPFMLCGHNENLAWALTVNRPDLIDTYKLEINPANPDEYRLDGRWRSLEITRIDVRVRQDDGSIESVNRELLRSVHGPAIRTDKGVYAIRYAGIGGLVNGLTTFYKLNMATNLHDWQAALAEQNLPSVNFIYADEAGNIGFVYHALFPARQPGFDWSGTLSGDRLDLVWRDYVPASDIPQIWNPESGYLYNVNNSPFDASAEGDDLKPSSFPPHMGIQMNSNNRALRVRETYGADRSIDEDEFYRYKYDITFSARSELVKAVETFISLDAAGDKELSEAQRVLEAWDRTVAIPSKGAALAIFGYQSVQTGASAREALLGAIKSLKKLGQPLDVSWGVVNRHIRGNVNVPLNGSPDVLRAVYGNPTSEGVLVAFGGDTFIMFVEWDKNGNLTSRSVHHWGSAISDPGSPHYADQAKLYATEKTKPVLFYEEQLAGKISREYRP